MSEVIREPSHSTEKLPAPDVQEDSGIATGKIILVGVISLLVFAVGSVWSIAIYKSKSREMNPSGHSTVPSELGKEEIGIVDQVPFELNRWVSKYKEEQNTRLYSYGWVDKKAGTIHIPIDRAMDLYLQEQKK